jgi:hypothetical protein
MLNLSNEALGAVMMALQKSLLEQSDIVPVLQGLDFKVVNDELYVVNPPLVKMSDFGLSEEDSSDETEEA